MDQIDLYIQEDLGVGDITSEALIDDRSGKAIITAGETGILAGAEEAAEVFKRMGCTANIVVQDGREITKDQIIMEVHGPLKGLLKAERLALNFLMRMSGIATETAGIVASCKGINPNVSVAATRKTTPGFRKYEKKAVRLGGGETHRYGLYDAFLIKDNHLSIVGSVFKAVRKAQGHSAYHKVEVEVEDMERAMEAARAGADIIMLDNMSPLNAKECFIAIKGIDERIVVEVSGGITADTAKDYAMYADVISIGALTHSVRSLHLSMHIVE